LKYLLTLVVLTIAVFAIPAQAKPAPGPSCSYDNPFFTVADTNSLYVTVDVIDTDTGTVEATIDAYLKYGDTFDLGSYDSTTSFHVTNTKNGKFIADC
jgi:hypothetical protein